MRTLALLSADIQAYVHGESQPTNAVSAEKKPGTTCLLTGTLSHAHRQLMDQTCTFLPIDNTIETLDSS